jgi:hypothetical protein
MKRRIALAAIAATAVTLAACNWGVQPKEFVPALGPAGASVAVRVTGETEDRVGEVYAADSAGITILSRQLVRIAWSRVRAVDVDQLGADYDVRPGTSVDAAKWARIALVSRFPQGMPTALLAHVLAKLEQATLEEVR